MSTPAGKKKAPGPSHEASLLSPHQSSPLRKWVSAEPRHITWIENVSSFTWWTDVYLPALGSREFTCQMLREFRADISRRNHPFSKMVACRATEPNSSPSIFLMVSLLVFVSFPCCCYLNWPLTWPAHTPLGAKHSLCQPLVQICQLTGCDHTDMRHISHFIGEKGKELMQTFPILNRSLFVFVVLIAAQSTGNVWVKVFRNVLQRQRSCGYLHLAATMEDMSNYTVLCSHSEKDVCVCSCVCGCVMLLWK